MLAAKREGVGIAANAAGVRAVMRRVEGQAAVAVVLGGIVYGLAHRVAVNRGDKAVDAAGIAAGEGLRPVVVPDAVRSVVIADAEVLEVFAGDGRVVVRAVAPGLDDGCGAAVLVGADVFSDALTTDKVGVIERVGAVGAFVFDGLSLGGEFLRAEGGVGGEAFVVGKGRQAFFGAQFVRGGEGGVQFGLGGGIGTGDAVRWQQDVAEADVRSARGLNLRFVVRHGWRRFGIDRGFVVVAASAAGGEEEQGKEADGGLGFHVGFLVELRVVWLRLTCERAAWLRFLKIIHRYQRDAQKLGGAHTA